MTTESRRDPLLNEDSSFSIPTAYAIDGIEKHLPTTTCDTILISVNTLIRNHINVDPDMHMTTLLDKLDEEMAAIVEDVSVVFEHVNVGCPAIGFYIMEYPRCVPKGILREDNKARARLTTAISYVLKTARGHFDGESRNIDNVSVTFSYNKRGHLPYQYLTNLVKSMSSNREVMLLSNCPLDYHLALHTKRFYLIDSHTGNMRKYSELGNKVFPKREELPFNPATHLLFGDKDFVQSPLGIKNKRIIYDAAIAQKWRLATHETIVQRLRTLGFPIKIKLG